RPVVRISRSLVATVTSSGRGKNDKNYSPVILLPPAPAVKGPSRRLSHYLEVATTLDPKM
ncbi:MAG: hypothetical protein ACRDH1_10295, partial [Actinomycetota bacterium]